MSFSTIPNPFRSIDDLWRQMRLPALKGDWRLTEHKLGEIQGLARHRGRMVATDGIIVLILDEVGVIRDGHISWFVPDKDEAQQRRGKAVLAGLQGRKRQEQVDDQEYL